MKTSAPGKNSEQKFEFVFINKVLFAEDDPMASRILSDALSSLGLSSKSMSSGEAVLEELVSGYYDLLILDKQLPGIDGLEVGSRVRNGDYAKYTKGIPILIITGEKLNIVPEYIDSLLIKPFFINQLGAAIYDIDLKLVNSKLLNPRYLLDVTNNNTDLIIELINIFIKDMPGNIDMMKVMAKKTDFEGLVKTLHKAISNVQYMGISGLDKMMESLEEEITQNPENIDILERLEEIEKLFNTGLEKLKLQKTELLGKL